MKPTSNIEQSLSRAIAAVTPNVLPDVLLRLKEEGEKQQMNSSLVIDTFPGGISPARRKPAIARMAKAAGSIAAVLALVFGIYMGYGYVTPQATIGLDVNPSVELSVNKYEKVLLATPLNSDAETILGSMDFKGVDLDIAVNALIGSMVKHGYISEIKNSVLISVDSRDAEKGAALQQRLSSEVDSALNAYSLNGAVLSQTVSQDDRLRALADEYHISLGKAQLVDSLVSQDETLSFADIASLPVNDINLLIANSNAQLAEVNSKGTPSSSGYIGEARATEIALGHAGVSSADLSYIKVKLDSDDGQLCYDIDFYVGRDEYEYEIDAISGAILEYEQDKKSSSAVTPPAVDGGSTTTAPPSTEAGAAVTPPSGGYIGLEKAVDISLTSAGVSASDVRIVKQVSYEKQGRFIYDVMFLSSTMKYTYHIDASTGEIVAKYTNRINGGNDVNYSDYDDDDMPIGNPADYIGADKAKSIAFGHAGVSADAARKVKVELDEDDGRMIYEISFEAGNTEYEYDIDAFSGAVLDWEADIDD